MVKVHRQHVGHNRFLIDFYLRYTDLNIIETVMYVKVSTFRFVWDLFQHFTIISFHCKPMKIYPCWLQFSVYLYSSKLKSTSVIAKKRHGSICTEWSEVKDTSRQYLSKFKWNEVKETVLILSVIAHHLWRFGCYVVHIK